LSGKHRRRAQTQVAWIRRFGFAEEDGIGATVKKGDLIQNVSRLPNESVDQLMERAVLSVPPGGVVSAWFYVDSRPE
jgi:hypothetical protein